jgi:hypothetical protein
LVGAGDENRIGSSLGSGLTYAPACSEAVPRSDPESTYWTAHWARLGHGERPATHSMCCLSPDPESSPRTDERASWWGRGWRIVKTCGLSVGGQLHLPAGGQSKLPAHGYLVTQRADSEEVDTPPEPSSTGT